MLEKITTTANTHDVYKLVTILCRSIYKQQNAGNKTNNERENAIVAKLKALAFAIILKKSKSAHYYEGDDVGGKETAQRALEKHIFAAKLHFRHNATELAKYVEFEQRFAGIRFESALECGVIEFLIALHDKLNGIYAPNMEESARELLVPGPFTLHANYQHNAYYPKNNWTKINDCTPRYFKAIDQMQTVYNPFKAKFFACPEDDQLMAIDRKYGTFGNAAATGAGDECSFTGMARRLCGSNMRINVNDLRLFPADGDCIKTKLPAITKQPKKEYLAPKVEKAVDDDDDDQQARIYTWNWESLNCFGIRRPQPFITETNSTLALQCCYNKSIKRQFLAKILTTEQFLKDLKCLTVGIRSDTFQYDELMVFSMQPHITIENVLPGTIENFAQDFLLCGTCYKRLQTMIMKRDYQLMFEGFIFKALCSAVDEYLLTFRQLVYAVDDTNLMSYYSRTKNMIKQINNLSFTLAIHPNVNTNVAPPLGSQFLGYIYREIMRITDRQYLMLLLFILKRCCHVYFKHLQKWIFYGLLDDPCNELFVGFLDHYRPNTKYFYDRAYFLRKESVPGFFQNYEDPILLCGKYTMLLKACKPNHPLFELECPTISVCLSFEELQDLQANCIKYNERAREVCGKAITIREILEARQEQKRNFKQYVQQKSKEHMQTWLDEQQQKSTKAAERKKIIFEELRLQMEDAQQRKRDERRANVERELLILRDLEKSEEEMLQIENTNLRKRIEYYQELNDTLEDEENSSIAGSVRNISVNIKGDCRQLIQSKSPLTPTSAHTDGSSFKSCCAGKEAFDKLDDDDNSSEYVECISEDFLNDADACEKIEQLHNDDDDKLMTNANKSYSPIRSEMQKNRQHVLSGSAMESCLQPTIKAAQMRRQRKMRPTTPPLSKQQYNQLKDQIQVSTTHAKSLPDINCNVMAVNDLTMLQQNRKRMMESNITEIQIAVEGDGEDRHLDALNSNDRREATIPAIQVDTQTHADINLNVVAAASAAGDSKLSDMTRNRNRMMDTDLFSELDKDPANERAQLKLSLNTDLGRNRKKVLKNEYGIVTGELNTLPIENVATPMSTTSDTPLTESLILPAELIENNNKLDRENGNVSEGGTARSTLKVNVNKANEPAAHLEFNMTAETPECALNTAGIEAKKCFDFTDARYKFKERSQQQHHLQTISEVLIDTTTTTTATTNELYFLPASPYERTMELIKSNFQCSPRSSLIRLNKQTNATKEDSEHKSSADDEESIATSKRICLHNMSAITITEFLQKSVIIPMSTHLDLVNNEVMRMFLDDLHLLDHLRSLRNYFFLMDGEFGLIICDGIIGKLEDGYTPVKLLNYQMLHSILDNALGYSIAGSQKNAENLSFIVNDIPDSFDLSSPHVLNNLCLSYRTKWPLNLIINPESIEQYANIFKYLLSVRRISFVLDRAYQILKEAVKKHGKDILKSPHYRHIQQIRHKFYNFVHALQNHITASALQASWKTFKDELIKAKSIEDIYRKHTAYIKRILFLCMLNRSSIEFYNAVDNIFKITLRFYKNLKSRDFKLRATDEYLTHGRYEKLIKDEQDFDKFIKYTIYLGKKIVRHGYQDEIGEFINLINFNNYYTPLNI